MKKLKKLLAVMLAAIMVMSMGMVSVSADNDATLTITASEGRTYSLYQIFDGTVSGSTLSGISWGSGVDSDKYSDIYAALKESTAELSTSLTVNGTTGIDTVGKLFTAMLSSNTAAEVANVLATYGNTYSEIVVEFANIIAKYVSSTATATITASDYDSSSGVYTKDFLDEGYYLIVETTDGSSLTNESVSRYMLDLISGTSNGLTPKEEVPDLTKKIVGDSSDVTSTDVSIGDTVNFKLTSTVPDMTGYSTYTYTVTDTLSKGLTLTTIDGTEDSETGGTVANAVSSSVTDKKALDIAITVGTASLKGIRVTSESDSAISGKIVDDYDFYYYTSTDTSNNTILTIVFTDFIDYDKGDAVIITYSAVLNSNATIGGSGNVNEATLTYSNNPTDSSDTSKTTKTKVAVFTFELDLTKVDAESTSTTLSGAQFVLYYTDDSGVKHYAVVDDNGTVTGWTVYQGFDSTDITYYVGTSQSTTTTVASVITSATDGTFVISGLDAKTYTLKEIVAPTGYVINGTGELSVVITAEEESTDPYSVKSLTATIGGEAVDSSNISTTEGTIASSIINSSSSTIPETGGMGTTILYIIGAILVISAAVILVTRRRMANK